MAEISRENQERGLIPAGVFGHEYLWLGKIDHQWPVQAFINERHAAHWLSGGTPDKPRRLWRVRVEVLEELRYVEPEPYLAAAYTTCICSLSAADPRCPRHGMDITTPTPEDHDPTPQYGEPDPHQP